MTVHIVASCTDRKRAAILPELRLREIEVGVGRAAAWLERLGCSAGTSKPARALYGGEHWQLALGLEAELAERHGDVALWVASAGYGLVSADAPLLAYSATFAPKHPDSVPGSSASAWWDALCEGYLAAKTLHAVASGADALVVIASAKYLRAMLPDLLRARAALADPERLIVFSGSEVAGLESALVRVDGRVQVALRDQTERELRGTKQGLAARTAKHLLTATTTWPPTATALREAYDQLVSKVAPPELPNRSPGTDGEVQAFIAAALDEDPGVGRTKLLRAWRSSGRACEQSRFRELFLKVQGART